jgi:hypothetical protein
MNTNYFSFFASILIAVIALVAPTAEARGLGRRMF